MAKANKSIYYERESYKKQNRQFMSQNCFAASRGSALQTYLTLADSARGKSAAEVVVMATSAPHVYVFGELLQKPSVVQLAESEETAVYYNLLKLFAFGTYQDYVEKKWTVPELNSNQILKLKYLSIVSLCAQQKAIPYDALKKGLYVEKTRDAEDLIISAISEGIVKGKFNQKEEVFEVDCVMGRDLILPNDVQNMLERFQAWSRNIDAVITGFDHNMKKAQNSVVLNSTQKAEVEKQVEENKAKAQKDPQQKDEQSAYKSYQNYGMDSSNRDLQDRMRGKKSLKLRDEHESNQKRR